jgi:hypothetical protein
MSLAGHTRSDVRAALDQPVWISNLPVALSRLLQGQLNRFAFCPILVIEGLYYSLTVGSNPAELNDKIAPIHAHAPELVRSPFDKAELGHPRYRLPRASLRGGCVRSLGSGFRRPR